MPTQLYAMDGMKVTEEAVVDEYKKQVAARSLYQVKPKNPYFFWSVMSLVLQAMERSPGWAAPCTVGLHKPCPRLMTLPGWTAS
jgi:hypothetical protein